MISENIRKEVTIKNSVVTKGIDFIWKKSAQKMRYVWSLMPYQRMRDSPRSNCKNFCKDKTKQLMRLG
ncbi:MAG: hypothetical protein K2O91_18280, partial [Lachnospiraceae bacterium]|nr:hypothetical protein [Lachnospiraceae bacterium]